MAIVTAVDLELVPFPSRMQRRSLEPDAIAYGRFDGAGDGTGGTNQVQYRARDSHIYILKSISLEHDGATTPGNIEFLFRAAWLGDAATFADGDFFRTMSIAELGITGRWILPVAGATQIIQAAAGLPLGRMRSSTDANIVLVIAPLNTNAETDRSAAMFWAYRREALTVPGFLENLVRPGIVR